MPHILTLTLNPSVDLSASTERVRPEHKLRCEMGAVDAGGGGITVSRVVQSLGGRTIAIFPEGGNTGTLLTERLAATGVPSAAVHVRAPTRLCVNVGESSTGHEYRFILPGTPLGDDELATLRARLEAELSGADAVVLSGSLPPGVPEDIYARIAAKARERGVRVILDTSGPALRHALGSGLFVVKPSRREFAELVGEPLKDVESLAAACRRVHRSGAAEVIVVSMGKEGALLTSSAGQWLAAPPRIEARSAVGAGDSFVAAATLALLRGDSHDRALAYGSAAGAAALLAPGTEVCSKDVVERLLPQVRLERIEARGS